jgi:hypothetical protein
VTIVRSRAITAALLVVAMCVAGALTGASAFGSGRTMEHAPVQQLPPGHITMALVRTAKGPVAIALHRIRYLGKVALCMSESNGGGTTQSCANYPLGPKSNQNIGNEPVWWTTYIGVCTTHRFQVISGVLLRRDLTPWLHTSHGVVKMPLVAIPPAFHIAGGLTYALIAATPESVSLRNTSGQTIYTEPVAPLTHLPNIDCSSNLAPVVSGSSSGHTIP